MRILDVIKDVSIVFRGLSKGHLAIVALETDCGEAAFIALKNVLEAFKAAAITFAACEGSRLFRSGLTTRAAFIAAGIAAAYPVLRSAGKSFINLPKEARTERQWMEEWRHGPEP